MKNKLLFVVSLLIAANLWTQKYPFQNPDLNSEERTKDLISGLILEEKAGLICDQSERSLRIGVKDLIGGMNRYKVVQIMII